MYHVRVQHSDAGWGGVLQKRFADFVNLADGAHPICITITLKNMAGCQAVYVSVQQRCLGVLWLSICKPAFLRGRRHFKVKV